uniref:Uncharacterized protein n=1 Tax=Anguilla anguilla TaxID=7936 RepID=A0A0E9S7J0_ANGAN
MYVKTSISGLVYDLLVNIFFSFNP